MGPISTSPITTNSLSCITRGKVAVLFRPRYVSAIINFYTSPWVAIIMTYIYPPITIINTDITLLFFMNIFIYTMRRNWWSQNLPQSHGLWEEACLVWELYPPLPSTSTLVQQFLEEGWLVYFGLDLPLPTLLLWQHPQFQEEGFMVSRDLCSRIPSPEDTSILSLS